MTEEQTFVVDLPKRFYDDHVSRELPAGRVVKELRRVYRIEATRTEIDEIRSDAVHYAHPDGVWMDMGLWSSAKATIRRIDEMLAEQEV